MSNKTQLQTNNTKLASLIETLQGKAAGGGSGAASLETCTVTFVNDDIMPPALIGHQTVYYTDVNGQTQSELWVPDETVITIIKGSFIVVTEWSSYSTQTNAVEIADFDGQRAFKITGDSIFGYLM